MRDRSYRRAEEVKAKRRAVKVLKDSWDYDPEDINPRNIGKIASTHGKPCSCYMCGNPRRHFKEPTIQERKQWQ